MTRRDKYIFIALALLVAVGGCIGVAVCHDGDKEQVFAYDQLARTGQWDKIIERAAIDCPTDELSVAYLNLALAKTGILAEAMFQFRQIGTDGLLPPQHPDFTSPLAAAEAYYHLGMTFTAERYAYEIQEAIPDFQKSRRMHQRLAQLYLTRGDSALARKLLRTLSLSHPGGDPGGDTSVSPGNPGGDTLVSPGNPGGDTLVWPGKAMRAPCDAKASPPREALPGTAPGASAPGPPAPDRFFQSDAPQNMLGLHFTDNPSNRLAYEYLLAWALLDRDLQSFMQYFNLPRGFDYPTLPRSYQEALMIVWSSQTNSIAGMPWPIEPEIAAQTREFLADMPRHSIDYMRDKYAGTYFLYFIDKQ